jgi:hypothetical protein
MSTVLLLAILAGILLVGGALTYVLLRKYKTTVSSVCSDSSCKVPKKDCGTELCTRAEPEQVEAIQNTTNLVSNNEHEHEQLQEQNNAMDELTNLMGN